MHLQATRLRASSPLVVWVSAKLDKSVIFSFVLMVVVVVVALVAYQCFFFMVRHIQHQQPVSYTAKDLLKDL